MNKIWEHFNDNEFRMMFEELFKQHFKSLCFHVMSFVNDKDAAKDIVHDVFLSVWKHRSEIDFSQPMIPYLFSLARNCSFNYLDHLKVKDHHIKQQLTFATVYPEPESTGEEELIAEIVARIGQLPERCAQVMRLCFIENKKYKEIAEELNISVNTVKTHITTGLKILRDEFSEPLILFFLNRINKNK